MLRGSMPNSATRSAFVDTATKCRATASSPSAATIHARAARAFSSVSIVPNVFETTTNSVRAGSRSRVACQKSLPSTFETKRHVSSGCAYEASASVAISGPRCEPPMPMLTTAPIRSPPAPRHSPPRTCSANAAIRSSTSCTGPTTSSPPTSIRAPRGARSAVCSTGRSSETLIRSPASIASMRWGSPACSASAASRSSVRGVIRCLEKSASRPQASTLSAAARSPSAAKSSVSERARSSPACSRSAANAGSSSSRAVTPTRPPRARRAWRRSSRAAPSTTSTNASAPLLCSSAASASTSVPACS